VNLSKTADQAARSLADEVRAKIATMPTTDTERIAIMVRVGELLSGVTAPTPAAASAP
jgi:hypothetical protein